MFPINKLSKQTHVMRCGMRKPPSLKVIPYSARLIDINKFLAVFPGAKASYKICVTEINKLLLNRMLNIWSKQAYVQGFDSESMIFKISVNIFERMERA